MMSGPSAAGEVEQSCSHASHPEAAALMPRIQKQLIEKWSKASSLVCNGARLYDMDAESAVNLEYNQYQWLEWKQYYPEAVAEAAKHPRDPGLYLVGKDIMRKAQEYVRREKSIKATTTPKLAKNIKSTSSSQHSKKIKSTCSWSQVHQAIKPIKNEKSIKPSSHQAIKPIKPIKPIKSIKPSSPSSSMNKNEKSIKPSPPSPSHGLPPSAPPSSSSRPLALLQSKFKSLSWRLTVRRLSKKA